MSIKTAVIGAGVMGKCHLDQLIQMDDVEVAALVDPHEPATRAAVEKYHISATYGDIEAMLGVLVRELLRRLFIDRSVSSSNENGASRS